MTRVEEIVKQLTEYSEAYYAGKEIVDDTTFDLLEDELRVLDPTNPYFSKLREKPAAYGTKVTHSYEFIGSLDKIHSMSESSVTKTATLIRASAKLDGASLVTYFRDGKLLNAVTRGDGKTGIDVTPHYLAITKKYSITIPEGYTGAVRGEVVFKLSNWEKFKQLHPEAKAPRNSGTGLINQKEVQPEEELLDYVIYDIVATNMPERSFDTMLNSFGYPIAPSQLLVYRPGSSNECTDEKMKDLYDAWKAIYPIDGVVLRDAKMQLEEHKGIYHYTKNQEAYKFQAELKVCTVRKIEWQLGRTGKLTPVLKIDPVEMSGAVVTSITAHNAANVKQFRLGKGAQILAYRSGEVIPTIKDTLIPADDVIIPTHCPYCGSKLETTATGKDIMCTYDGCDGKSKFKVFNFIECMCSDIKGLGDVFLENFVGELADVYSIRIVTIANIVESCLSFRGNTFTRLGNADNKIAKQVITRLTTERYSAEKFWLGLGIRLLGTEAAKKLGQDEMKTTHLIDAILSHDIYYITDAVFAIFPGQQALANYIAAAAKDVRDILLVIAHMPVVPFVYNAAPTATRYYAITGSLSKSRKEIQTEFLAKGWEMTDNLNRAEVLITNTPNSNSSKNLKARALNKEVLSEEDFRVNYL